MSDTAPTRRRWFPRFSIRTILMLVVAVPLAWKTNQIRTQRRAVAVINVNGFCRYRSQRDQVTPPGPEWLRRLAGDDIFDTVVSAHFPHGSGKEGLACLATLSGLERASMEWARDQDLIQIAKASTLRDVRALGLFSDAALDHLADLERLEVLELNNPQLTGEGLRRFENLSALRVLNVSGNELTDANVAWIARHESLETVRLASNRLTDATLKQFEGAAMLSELELSSPHFSDEAIRRLRAALPDCQMEVIVWPSAGE